MKLFVPLCLTVLVTLGFYVFFFLIVESLLDGQSLCKEALRYQQFQYYPHRNPCM